MRCSTPRPSSSGSSVSSSCSSTAHSPSSSPACPATPSWSWHAAEPWGPEGGSTRWRTTNQRACPCCSRGDGGHRAGPRPITVRLGEVAFPRGGGGERHQQQQASSRSSHRPPLPPSLVGNSRQRTLRRTLHTAERPKTIFALVFCLLVIFSFVFCSQSLWRCGDPRDSVLLEDSHRYRGFT